MWGTRSIPGLTLPPRASPKARRDRDFGTCGVYIRLPHRLKIPWPARGVQPLDSLCSLGAQSEARRVEGAVDSVEALAQTLSRGRFAAGVEGVAALRREARPSPAMFRAMLLVKGAMLAIWRKHKGRLIFLTCVLIAEEWIILIPWRYVLEWIIIPPLFLMILLHLIVYEI